MAKLVHVSQYLPIEYIRLLDELVGQGRYPSRSEAMRIAIRDLLRSETTWKVKVSDRLARLIQEG